MLWVGLALALCPSGALAGLQNDILGAAAPPSEACQSELDAFCNADAGCVATIRKDGFALPLVARFDVGGRATQKQKQWRCYSPSSLSPDLAHFTTGSAYCSRGAELGAVLEECESGAAVLFLNATEAFSATEAAACAQIRTPQLVATASGKVLLFAQCRNAPHDGGGDGGDGGDDGGLADDFRQTRMVVKESPDGGATWPAPMRFVTERGTGVGVAVYDRNSSRLVLQYQTMPFVDPYRGNTLWQTLSADEGATWSAPRDITAMIAGSCNADPALESVCGGAGSRIQTAGGRLVFSGHNKGSICVWYSDDGGRTYATAASGPFQGNEQSIAQLGDGTLYMNGRGTQFPWRGNRTEYRSPDGGATWTAGAPSALTDVECEAAVIAVRAPKALDGVALFFSEPTGPGRVSFRIHCSCDGGRSWPSSIIVNPGAVAAYSSLLEVQREGDAFKLLAVWEQKPTQLAHVFDADWCKCIQ